MKNLSLAKKANQVTYGLLYPAFFGNMIYDLILPRQETHHFSGLKFWTGFLILLFYALDYIHLYGDLEESVGKNVENKSWLYIGCDAFTSVLFFVSFVLLKYGELNWSIACIGVIPITILGYKLKHRLHKTDLNWMYAFSAISVIGTLICVFVVQEDFQLNCFFAFLVAELIYYGVYVLYYYSSALKKEIDARNEAAKAKAATVN